MEDESEGCIVYILTIKMNSHIKNISIMITVQNFLKATYIYKYILFISPSLRSCSMCILIHQACPLAVSLRYIRVNSYLNMNIGYGQEG